MKHSADDPTPAPPAKKSRGNTSHAATVALVNSILANPKGYPISGNEDVVRKSLVDLASYARSLELQLSGAAAPAAGPSKAAAAPKPVKSQAELEAAADKLRKAAVSGIKKQMSVSGAHICTSYLSPTRTRPLHTVEAFMQDWLGEVVVRRHLRRSGGLRRTHEPRWSSNIQNEEVLRRGLRELPRWHRCLIEVRSALPTYHSGGLDRVLGA